MSTDCICGRILVHGEPVDMKMLNPDCPVHGVGSAHWQALPQMPFGFHEERYTTREEWMAIRAQGDDNGDDDGDGEYG